MHTLSVWLDINLVKYSIDQIWLIKSWPSGEGEGNLRIVGKLSKYSRLLDYLNNFEQIDNNLIYRPTPLHSLITLCTGL